MSQISLGAEVAPGGPFAIVDDGNIRGGYRVVADHATRDGIIADDRKQGMLVRTLNDSLIWELASDLTTWNPFASGGGGASLATTPPVNVDKSAAAVGTGTTAARADHKHDINVAAPINIGTANAVGSASTLALSDHVHNLPFTPVQTALAAATADVSVNNHKLTNLLAGAAPTDAVTKAQLDTALLGLTPKAAAKTIAESNVTSLSGPQTINGVSLIANDRVLLIAQTSAVNNGAWLVQAGAWIRPSDFLTGSSAAGAFLFINQGTVDAGTGWVCSNLSPNDVVDTNPLTFVQFSTFALASVAPLDVDKTTAQIGISSRAAKEDHKHSISTAAPSTISTANSEGTSSALARADHLHSHGVQADPTYHALATSLANGFLSASDFTKLSGIPGLASILGAVIVEDPSGTRVARRLTADDIDPAFSVTGFSGGPGSAELGTTITSPSFSASYNASLAGATINDGSGAIALVLPYTLAAYNGGASLSPPTFRTYQVLTVNGVQSWTLTATKLGGSPVKTAVISQNLGLTRAYFDIVTVPGTFNQAFIKSLGNNILTSTRSHPYTLPAGAVNKKIYLCWPAAFGNPGSIHDQNGFVFPMTKRPESPVAFTNTVGIGFSVPGGYDIWESDNFITAAFTITVG